MEAATLDRECPFYSPTIADHIRNMSDEELAEFIDEISGYQADYIQYKHKTITPANILEWLRQPIEEMPL